MNKKIFTDNDYNSSDGMLTSIWGPSLWHTLHTISFNYPIKPTKKDKENYYNFIISLEHVYLVNIVEIIIKIILKI